MVFTSAEVAIAPAASLVKTFAGLAGSLPAWSPSWPCAKAFEGIPESGVRLLTGGRWMELSSTWGGIASALAFVMAAGVGAAAESGKASFDCTKAKSVAETMICADPGLAAADADIAANYAAALKRLDSPARKALAQDQQDFVSYRDRIAGFDQGVPKDKQNLPIDEFMRDRAAFLGSIEKPDAGFVGSWKNVGGDVTIKSAGSGKLEIEADTANPSTGGSECNVGGVGESAKDPGAGRHRRQRQGDRLCLPLLPARRRARSRGGRARRRATKVSRRRAGPMAT